MRWFAQKNFTSWSKSLSLSMGKLSNSGEKALWTRWKRAEYHSVILSEVVLDHSSSFGAKSISRVVEPVVCQLLAFATHCNSFVLVIGHPRFDPSIWRCWVSICCWMWKPVMNVLWISVFVIAYMKLIRRTGQVVIWYENIWYISLVSSCFFQFHPHMACREASMYVETGAKRFLERTWGERAKKRCILRACGAKWILIRFCIILVRKLPVYLEALRSWGPRRFLFCKWSTMQTPWPQSRQKWTSFPRLRHSLGYCIPLRQAPPLGAWSQLKAWTLIVRGDVNLHQFEGTMATPFNIFHHVLLLETHDHCIFLRSSFWLAFLWLAKWGPGVSDGNLQAPTPRILSFNPKLKDEKWSRNQWAEADVPQKRVSRSRCPIWKSQSDLFHKEDILKDKYGSWNNVEK